MNERTRIASRLAALADNATVPYRNGWIEGYLSEENGHTEVNRRKYWSTFNSIFVLGFDEGVEDYKAGVR